LSLGVKNKDQVAHSTCGLQHLVIESKLGQSFVSLDELIICSLPYGKSMLRRREGVKLRGWHGVRIKGADLSDLVEVT
jgi:hypothetical protein